MSTPAHTPTLVYWSLDNEVWRGDKRILVIDSGLDEDSPNTAFIVRACNSHAALVAALEQVCFVLTDEYGANATWPCIAQARAALAAAQN